MKLNIVKKQHKRIDSKGHEEIWEWNETPELREFIAKYGKKETV